MDSIFVLCLGTQRSRLEQLKSGTMALPWRCDTFLERHTMTAVRGPPVQFAKDNDIQSLKSLEQKRHCKTETLTSQSQKDFLTVRHLQLAFKSPSILSFKAPNSVRSGRSAHSNCSREPEISRYLQTAKVVALINAVCQDSNVIFGPTMEDLLTGKEIQKLRIVS